MRLFKPTWLNHDGNPIFSIDISPDDTRVVTGGQGHDSAGRVVIWDMQSILEEKDDLNAPKLLCQLDHHTAIVNCVRWSNSGKYLCSGGDDRVIIVWKLLSRYNPKLNSSSSSINSAFNKNLEQWKTQAMLRAHSSDVLDLAWSPEDNYLASASVDNTVIIWDAINFPKVIATLNGHSSLVKGVTWDPVGKYLATQSDDKSLKVWRVSDWELEQTVMDPFTECGGTTHVLRLDWSPDGSYLVSAHAMNGGGPTAQIIERSEWKTDKDFVGHRKAVVCVKFNGNILQNNNSRIKHCCVALGSRDKSVSIWSTSLKRPLVVIKDLFSSSVTDLSWSSCGTIMMACSVDGSVAAAQFSWEEIGKPLSSEEKANFYHKLYGKSVSSSGNCDIIQNLDVVYAKRNAISSSKHANQCENSTSPSNEARNVAPVNPELMPQPVPQPPKGPTDKQIETIRADGKKRITPIFLLPHSDAEQQTPPRSEQTVFMQGKGKEDTVANTQATVQDWRKSMVSRIENVKGFSDTAAVNNKSASTSKEPAEAGKAPERNNNEEVEAMEVEEEGSGEKGAGGNKLVNGNHPVNNLAEGPEERKKTDDTARTSASATKEKLTNGESPTASSVPRNLAGTSSKDGGVPKSKNGVLVNGVVADKDPVKQPVSKEKSPVITSSAKPDEIVNSGSSTTSKKDQLPAPPPAQTNKEGVNLIAVRKKNKNAPEEPPKVTKKVKLVTPGREGTLATGESDISKLPQSSASHSISGATLTLPPQRSSLGGSSPSKAESSKSHHRLPPMKIDTVLSVSVNVNESCSYTLQAANHYKRPDGICHQVTCVHSNLSLNGLEWTICTDAPICCVSGDKFRIIVLCENSTLHALDTKGRYAFPPMVLSGYPSKFVQNGQFLAVVTTKAIIHVWDIYTPRVVLKSESLLPLLNQGDSEKERALDIHRVQVAAGGLPIIVLNTGKKFMYNFDLATWFLISDPRGPVSSPLPSSSSDQSLSSRMMLFSGDGRLRQKPAPSIVTNIKLKLATSYELKNRESIEQEMMALAKSLATFGLDKELRQLCEDLLGPTHSSANSTTSWPSKIKGIVDKRQLLRRMLNQLFLDDLKFQNFYSEFDELLKDVEEQNKAEKLASTSGSNSTPTA